MYQYHKTIYESILTKIIMALAARSNFGNVPKNGRYNDLQATTLGFTDLKIGSNTFTWPTDTPVVNDVLTVTAYATSVATLEWVAPIATAGGNDTEVQFNSSGILAGDSSFVWDSSGKVMALNLFDNKVFCASVEGQTGGNNLLIQVQEQTTGDTDGGVLTLNAGTGEGTGDGGNTLIRGGLAGATGVDGFVQLDSNARYGTKSSVTQITNITTAVAVTSFAGQITTVNSTLGNGASVTFTVNLPGIIATDVVQLQLHGYTDDGYLVLIPGSVTTGSFTVTIQNRHTIESVNNVPIIMRYLIL